MIYRNWNPWLLFLSLDYFSRIYFAGVLFAAVWTIAKASRILIGVRSLRRNSSLYDETAYLRLERMGSVLRHGISLSMVFTSGCCINQIFFVWFTYMVRATDANPFLALRQAWVVMQLLVCLLVSQDVMSRCAYTALERRLHD